MRRYLRVILLIFCCAAITSAGGRDRGGMEMQGQIVVYRPAEMLLQMASFVINRESFVFKVTSAGSKSQPAVMKLVYEHYGYSELSGKVLEKAPTLEIRVRRDSKCDETYGAYLQNSPTFKGEDGKVEMDKVVFVEPFQTMNLSPQQPLKCYQVQSESLRVSPGTPNH